MNRVRISIIASIVLFFTCSAFGMELTSIAPSSATTVIVTQSGRLFVMDEIAIQVPAGVSTIALDHVAADIDAATVALRVLRPANADVKLERYMRPDAAGTLLWTVSSPSAQPLVLQMRYVPKGITVKTSYRALVAEDGDSIALTATVTTGNAGKTAHEDVAVRLPSGHSFRTELPLGRTITRELFSLPNIPISQQYVYDEALYAQNVMSVMQMVVPEMDGRLLAGPVDFYVGKDGIEKRIGSGELPFCMAGTNIDTAVRTASDIQVTGGAVSREQLNVKQDVYKKLALYDLREKYSYTFSNTSDRSAEVIFRAHHSGDWNIEDAGANFVRTDATTAEWTVTVPAFGELVLAYSIMQKNIIP